MPCNAIKLVDVQEMNYLAAKGEGEVSNFRKAIWASWEILEKGFFFVREITQFSESAKHGLLPKI